MASFFKNVVNITLGNIIAQGITLVTVPIITRIYSPEAYGLFSIYLSITMILSPISTLHFNRAMMLPENQNDSANLLGLSFLSVIAFTLVLIIGVTFISFPLFLSKISFLGNIKGYLWLLPLGVFIQGSYVAIIYWALRNKMFGNMAVARIAASISDRGFVLSTGYFAQASAIGLIGGRIVGPFAAQCFLIWRTLKHEFKTLCTYLSITEMKRIAMRYRNLCFFSILSDLITRGARETPLMLLVFFFSPTEAGFYALAMRVINMPMVLIGDAISKVFLQRATADKGKSAELLKDTVTLLGYLIFLSLPAVLILLYFGERLFIPIFGSEWSMAGKCAQVLAISFFLVFLYRPLSALFLAFEHQKQRLMISLLLFIGRGGAIVTAAYLDASLLNALFFLMVVTCIVYTGAYVYLFKLLEISAIESLRIILNKMAMMAPLIIGLSILKFFMCENYFIVVIVFASFLIFLQGIILLMFEPELKKITLRFIPIFPLKKWRSGYNIAIKK